MMNKHNFLSKTLALLLAGGLGWVDLSAQGAEKADQCGFEMSTADWSAHRGTVQALRQNGGFEAMERGGNPTLYVGVAMHIVRSGDGSQGLSNADAELALERANLKYEPVGIQFFQCEPIHVVESDYWYDLEFLFKEWVNECGSDTPEYDFDAQYHVPNMINIYWVNTNGWSWSAGPGAIESACMDWVIMHQGHADSYRTLAHELGHYLGLPHTFSGFDENVTRNAASACHNCEEEGDLFCDTPADYHDNTDDHGSWDGCDPSDEHDECGVLLTPDPENIMSYCHCNTQQQHFSNQQEAAMRYNLTHGRHYITCQSSCVPFWTFNNTHSWFYTYRAEDYILSTATLSSGVSVKYRAGDYIRLSPGFSAPRGTVFSARISACNAGALPPETTDRKAQVPNTDWQASLQPTLATESTTLSFRLPEAAELGVLLVAADGRLSQRILSQKELPAGEHSLRIDCSKLLPGVYRVLLRAGTYYQALPLLKS